MFINGKYHKIFETKTNTSGFSFLNNSSTYSSLPNPTTVSGKYYYVLSSQGTKWLPWSLGGTYYPNGLYYSDGTNWVFSESPSQASQSIVDSGIVTDQFVSPATLNSYSGWNKIKVGLNNVDNTNDANKPISIATIAALETKVDKIITVNGQALSSSVTINKSDIGLGDSDNTSDINKPISILTQAALTKLESDILLYNLIFAQ